MNSKIRLLIAGSRGFNDYELLKSEIDKLVNQFTNPIEIISGCAKGADTLGERYAEEHNLSVLRFPADWKTHGVFAGYIRNEEMAQCADLCIVFWDSKSRGTKNMIEKALRYHIPLIIVRYKELCNS